MRISILITVLSFLTLPAVAQDYAKAKNSSAIKQEIAKKHAATNTLQADFSEEVHSAMFAAPQKGSGQLHFKKEDKIRWETSAPVKRIILINGSTVKLSENGKTVSNPGTNKVVKKVQGMMLSMLSGDFLNEQDFSITYFENSKNYKLILVPKHPRMARYIEEIQLVFNRQTALLSEMTMQESKNEYLVYTFRNIRTNTTINDQQFNQF